MDKTGFFIVDLIKKYIDNSEVSVERDFDYDTVYEECLKQSVYLIAYNKLNYYMPEDVKKKWKNYFLKYLQYNMNIIK